MNCPRCGEKLDASLDEDRPENEAYEEIEFSCVNGHSYFARVAEDDLMEEE